MSERSSYQPEIDGLRALAVLAVLFYHLDFGWAPGGFVGVDVFFVLSGYLITRLIAGEIESSGRFDFAAFYMRRFRRLFPALLFWSRYPCCWPGRSTPSSSSASGARSPAGKTAGQ